MARDLYRLKSAFERHDSVKKYHTFQVLVSVFEQQCEITNTNTVGKKAIVDKHDSKNDSDFGNGEASSDCSLSTPDNSPDPEIKIRKKPQGERIISSPHNSDAVYTRKRDQKVVGHKAFVTETCDPKNPVQMITDVNLEKATHSDSKENPKIDERLIKAEFKPETRYSDAGFVNGETILKSAEEGINLAGPSSGRSQSFESFEKEDILYSYLFLFRLKLNYFNI